MPSPGPRSREVHSSPTSKWPSWPLSCAQPSDLWRLQNWGSWRPFTLGGNSGTRVVTGGGGSLLGRWNGQEDLGCLPLVGVQYLASHLSPRYEYGPDSEVVGAGGLFECPGCSGCGGSAPGCDDYSIPWGRLAIREKLETQPWNSLWQWPSEWMMVKVRFLKEHQALGLRTLSPTHVNCPICKYLYHLDSEAKKTFTNQIHSVFSFLPVCFVLGLFSFPETRSNWMFSFSTSHG